MVKTQKGFIFYMIFFALILITIKTNLSWAIGTYPHIGSYTDYYKINSWSEKQINRSLMRIIDNLDYGVNVLEGKKGAVIASPGTAVDPISGIRQNYRYHWVRDAAIVMHSLITVYRTSTEPFTRKLVAKHIRDYITFSKENQAVKSPYGFGEPKFNLNGTLFDEPWGRPQNDGPALRALTLMQWIDLLLSEGHNEEARNIFLNVVLPDLKYTAVNINDNSIDVWEEVMGQHFFVKIIQSAALNRGTVMTRYFQQTSDISKLQNAATSVNAELSQFFSTEKNYIESTKLNWGDRLHNKSQNLDVAVILGVLYADIGSDLSFEQSSNLDSWTLATAEKLRSSFEAIYPINKAGLPGVLIGRYPEDHYFGGNPWPIATLSLAELYYKTIEKLELSGQLNANEQNIGFFNHLLDLAKEPPIKIGEILNRHDSKFINIKNTLFMAADAIVYRVRYHMGTDDDLYEQLDKYTGYLTALPHLTWSHAAFINTLLKRKNISEKYFNKSQNISICIGALSEPK
ncbi:MAG: hypothetical protein A2Z20_07270 [Bdellovibrionales bacterium RBG_16_40_8]|nr:MAG: hypothetical protein A2Z20_07270 [Bdellovibrionales bacterium RBG_16_40_8]